MPFSRPSDLVHVAVDWTDVVESNPMTEILRARVREGMRKPVLRLAASTSVDGTTFDRIEFTANVTNVIGDPLSRRLTDGPLALIKKELEDAGWRSELIDTPNSHILRCYAYVNDRPAEATEL
jgi:hypothetical protein